MNMQWVLLLSSDKHSLDYTIYQFNYDISANIIIMTNVCTYTHINISYILLIAYSHSDIPIVQLWPIHPAIHVQRPSVCLHVLQLGEQTSEQFVP